MGVVTVVLVVFGVCRSQREGSLARSADVFGTWTGPPGNLVGLFLASTDSSSVLLAPGPSKLARSTPSIAAGKVVTVARAEAEKQQEATRSRTTNDPPLPFELAIGRQFDSPVVSASGFNGKWDGR